MIYLNIAEVSFDGSTWSSNTITVVDPVSFGNSTCATSCSGGDSGASCGVGYLPYGTVVTVKAIPGSGSVFSGWYTTDRNSSVQFAPYPSPCISSSNICTFPLDDRHSGSIYAVFSKATNVRAHIITIKKDTTRTAGTGTVVSIFPDDTFINCGNKCSPSVAHGTFIRLEAKPDADSVFVGWRTDLNRCVIGTCNVYGFIDETITAFFNKKPARKL